MIPTTTTLYRVTGTRRTNGRRETVTALRRQWPAAERLAARWEELDRSPVHIDAVVIAADRWVSVR